MRSRKNRRTSPTTQRERADQIQRLEYQIARQQRRIAELERVRDAVRTLPTGAIEYEGTCAECGIGVVVRTNDTLTCTSCPFHCNL